MTYVCYSTASCNVLSHGASVESALIASDEVDRDFLVVAKVLNGERLLSCDPLPETAQIVWRGANELAQRFRASTSNDSGEAA